MYLNSTILLNLQVIYSLIHKSVPYIDAEFQNDRLNLLIQLTNYDKIVSLIVKLNVFFATDFKFSCIRFKTIAGANGGIQSSELHVFSV